MYDPNNPWLNPRPLNNAADWVAQNLTLRAACHREVLRQRDVADLRAALAPKPRRAQRIRRLLTSSLIFAGVELISHLVNHH